jgi:hypothetical protein
MIPPLGLGGIRRFFRRKSGVALNKLGKRVSYRRARLAPRCTPLDRQGRAERKRKVLEALLFGGCVTVRVPSASFELEGADTHDLFSFAIVAPGAFVAVGPDGDQFFENVAAFAFEFIYRHGDRSPVKLSVTGGNVGKKRRRCQEK